MMKKQQLSYMWPLVSMWMFLSIYFYANDVDAFILFMILPPLLGIILYISIKTKYVVLTMFFSLSFVSHAINPAFFFLNRANYAYDGWGAVKDFTFDLSEFFPIYRDVYLLLICIFIFTILLNKLFNNAPSKTALMSKSTKSVHCPDTSERQVVITKRSKSKKGIYSLLICLFIFFFVVPLNLFMYTNGIGISTIDPKRLPFKLVGITFYLRNYIVPTIITYLYYRSRRTNILTALILFYGMLVGILSLSKGNVILTILPVVLFSFIDNKKMRLYFSILYAIFLYSMVSWARQFVFISSVGSIEMIENIFSNLIENDFIGWQLIVTFLNTFSERLYGAQSAVLAYQSNVDDNITEIFNFLLARRGNLPDILLNDLFGLHFTGGEAFGVGIGYLPTLILLANKNLVLLILLALVTAIYLTISEIIITKYISGHRVINMVGYPLGFFMVFYLYDSFMGKFYFIIMVSLIGLLLLKILTKHHTRLFLKRSQRLIVLPSK